RDELRRSYSLQDDEVLTLARWALAVEDHYSGKHGAETPMDIEWARDGLSGALFLVQARPETVHSRRAHPTVKLYALKHPGQPLLEGLAIGDGVVVGRVRVIRDPRQLRELRPGEVLVTEATDPDWE